MNLLNSIPANGFLVMAVIFGVLLAFFIVFLTLDYLRGRPTEGTKGTERTQGTKERKGWAAVLVLAALVLGIMAIPLTQTGCATEKVVSTNDTLTTNASGAVTTNVTETTNTVVNQANLSLDTALLQGGATLILSTIVQKDPGAVPALKDVQMGITGILNGANTNSTSQLLSTVGLGTNAALVTELKPLVTTVRTWEQSLIAKYGANNAGQITLAVATAVNNAFALALLGQ